MSYIGSNIERERPADNRKFYQSLLATPSLAAGLGMMQEDIKKQLTILKQFPPDIDRHRLVGHSINIYAINSPSWQKRGDRFRPRGQRENIFSMDFGAEIRQICENETSLHEDIGISTVLLGDGTSITGVRTKTSNYLGLTSRKIIPNDYLNIIVDYSTYQQRKMFMYQFDIRLEAISAQNPMEFHIRSYVSINGALIEDNEQVARPVFLPSRNRMLPGDLDRLTFTAK